MTGLAREYGNGLYELAREEGLRDQLHDELQEIGAVIESQPEFIRLLSSRAIERDVRLNVVEDTFGGRAHPYVVSFMKLMVEKERIEAFGDCVKWFHQRYNDDFGIIEAEVTSAVPLDQPEYDALKARLDQMSGKNVSLICRVDPALLGGVRVEMEGRRYDNTIQNKLGRLRHSLAKGM
ncbi:MAG: ATP synthase F1 subunit delta [Clostridia bacterium]|nr:ATP synthase F1 subunit delta [Clostridia bacterium]